MSTEPRPGDVIRVSYETTVAKNGWYPGCNTVSDSEVNNRTVEVILPAVRTVLFAPTVDVATEHINDFGMNRKEILIVTPRTIDTALRGKTLPLNTLVVMLGATVSNLFDLVTAIAPCTVGQE
jgi:hypothetical protein